MWNVILMVMAYYSEMTWNTNNIMCNVLMKWGSNEI